MAAGTFASGLGMKSGEARTRRLCGASLTRALPHVAQECRGHRDAPLAGAARMQQPDPRSRGSARPGPGRVRCTRRVAGRGPARAQGHVAQTRERPAKDGAQALHRRHRRQRCRQAPVPRIRFSEFLCVCVRESGQASQRPAVRPSPQRQQRQQRDPGHICTPGDARTARTSQAVRVGHDSVAVRLRVPTAGFGQGCQPGTKLPRRRSWRRPGRVLVPDASCRRRRVHCACACRR